MQHPPTVRVVLRALRVNQEPNNPSAGRSVGSLPREVQQVYHVEFSSSALDRAGGSYKKG